jgi:mannan endo-1,4-beta-mannosidase
MKGIWINVFILTCFPAFAQPGKFSLIDSKATSETKALYKNLKKISAEGFMFGHQEADAYGTTWKKVEGRSDVKDVCGAHPAVHGWDIGNENETKNVDGVPFEDMLQWVRQTYERGGVNTISWHMDNPVTGADSWAKQPVVADILPGGKGHEAYRTKLSLAADFLNKCETEKIKIPIIFRPFHEHIGDWFWWGKGNCSEEDYIKLWRFTVDYLKNERGLHHLIYAFSPDRSRLNLTEGKQDYFYGYPGDDYVDLLGLDNYMDVGVTWNKKSKEEQRKDFVIVMKLLSALGKEKNKVTALTETGLEGITNPIWFSDVILAPIKQNPGIQIAYVLVWRNANNTHHYAPYPGHPAHSDFLKFYKDPMTFFESDLSGMYKE